MHFLIPIVTMAVAVIISLLTGALILHLIPKLGSMGVRVSAALCHAPALDWVIIYFTVLPMIVGLVVSGWRGLIGAIAGQVASVLIWSALHELARRDAAREPRIVSLINRYVGPWRNHTAIWLTAIVTPLFTLIRMAEVLIYPPIQKLVGFPSYKGSDWVRVSRHKFSGLVGHDMIWCLYCDWMTGVWSLGSEMLRNVESFWCPIRFDSSKKCDNCSVDFPDIKGGWVAADGNMTQVIQLIEQTQGGEHHSWFGHPVRITVKGNEVN
jgi:hypothetical protein